MTIGLRLVWTLEAEHWPCIGIIYICPKKKSLKITEHRTAKLSITKNPVANFDDDLPCLDYQWFGICSSSIKTRLLFLIDLCKSASHLYMLDSCSWRNTELLGLVVAVPLDLCGKNDHSCHKPSHWERWFLWPELLHIFRNWFLRYWHNMNGWIN